jgi:hypothetical protein
MLYFKKKGGKMKKRRILSLVFMALVAGFLLFEGTVSAKGKKKPFNGKGKILVRGSFIHGANGIMFDKTTSCTSQALWVGKS